MKRYTLILLILFITLILSSDCFAAEYTLYRSVGTNSADLNNNGPQVEILGTTATFASNVANNIGVGDVLQYSTGPSLAIAFISSRTSDTVFTVQDYLGGSPEGTDGYQNCLIYRAFNSLWGWEQQSAEFVNPNIDGAVRSQVLYNSQDLVTDQIFAMVACYGDGPDNLNENNYVNIGAEWTTNPEFYIKIYTPVTLSEVGTSQRHNGKFKSSGAYYINSEPGSGNSQLAITSDQTVKIDGLQFSRASVDSGFELEIKATGASSTIEVSNCIFRASDMDNDTDNRGGLRIYDVGTMIFKVWNNIFYDFKYENNSQYAVYIDGGDSERVFFYNNTIFNCNFGIWGDPLDYTEVINTITNDCIDGYYTSSGNHDDSDYNISDIADDMPGGNSQNETSVVFVNEGNDDFRLDFTDTYAKDNGIDLSGDSDLAFSTDIEGQKRRDDWSIGADECMVKSVIRNAVIRSNAKIR